MKRITTLTLLFIAFSISNLAAANPATWTFKLVKTSSTEIQLLATVTLADGWHMYDTDIPEGGPYATSIDIDEIKGATAIGKLTAVDGKLIKEYDKLFEMEVGFYKTTVSFAQKFKITNKSTFSLKGNFRAQTCNDQECNPPIPVEFSFSDKDLSAAKTAPKTKK